MVRNWRAMTVLMLFILVLVFNDFQSECGELLLRLEADRTLYVQCRPSYHTRPTAWARSANTIPTGRRSPRLPPMGSRGSLAISGIRRLGFDYAKNRYHNPGTGRFLTPDPYRNSARATDPRTWNRYAYTNGDPVNFKDPTGLGRGFVPVCDPNDPTCGDDGDSGDGEGGAGGWDYDYPCGANALTEVPGQGCVANPGPGILPPPPPPCPLAGIFGDFTLDPNSPTPVHPIFNPTVAEISYPVIAELNKCGN